MHPPVRLPRVLHLLEGHEALGPPVVQLVGEVVRVAQAEGELDVVQRHAVRLQTEQHGGPVGEQHGQLPGLAVLPHRAADDCLAIGDCYESYFYRVFKAEITFIFY